MFVDLVAMRTEFVERIRACVPTLKAVEPVEDISKDVLAAIVPKLNDPFALVCLSDEGPGRGDDLDDDGYADETMQIVEHDISIVIGTKSLLSQNAATESALVIRQEIKAAFRDWFPTQAFAKRVPRRKGVNRIGRYGAIALHAIYLGQTVLES